jgi:hypothetical protein
MEDIRPYRTDDQRREEEQRLALDLARESDHGFDGEDDVPFYIPRD